jgi:hypothetical protein
MSKGEGLSPDPQYRLTDTQRERLAQAFDPDAVQKVLAYYPDAARCDAALSELLELADRVARGEIAITGMRFLGEDIGVRRAVASLEERSVCGRQPAG